MSIWYMVCWLGRSLVGLLVFRSRYSPLVHAVCIHSLLTFLFWLHLDYLVSLSLSLCFLGWIMSALCRLLFPAHLGVQVFNIAVVCLQIWQEHVVFVSSILALGFLGSKRVSPSSFIVSVWNQVLSWAKGMEAGKRQKSSWSLI
ncbi:hypothetical protein BDW68DRAFT_118146 [Aspergillus falconensis]